jgi:hypothetical protein
VCCQQFFLPFNSDVIEQDVARITQQLLVVHCNQVFSAWTDSDKKRPHRCGRV